MNIRIDLICEVNHVSRDVIHDNTQMHYDRCEHLLGECQEVTEQYYGERREGEGNWVMRGKGNDGFSYDDD